MTAYLLLVHLLNLLAPAVWMAGLMVLLPRLLPGLRQAQPVVASLKKQALIGLVVNVAVLLGGLALWGQDGKMLTYAALVVASALCQFVLLRGWQR